LHASALRAIQHRDVTTEAFLDTVVERRKVGGGQLKLPKQRQPRKDIAGVVVVFVVVVGVAATVTDAADAAAAAAAETDGWSAGRLWLRLRGREK
jgi:hypothetical protein